MADRDRNTKAKFGGGATGATLGSKLHKTFMAEIGEEMCQAEVAHHANRCPEFFCSRPVKYVHLYKKALALSLGEKKLKATEEAWDGDDVGAGLGGDDWGDDEDWERWAAASGCNSHPATSGKDHLAKSRRATTRSDVELYETRAEYWFAAGSGLSPHLPHRDTPELQVADACLYDFFRLVKFHGGKTPYFHVARGGRHADRYHLASIEAAGGAELRFLRALGTHAVPCLGGSKGVP